MATIILLGEIVHEYSSKPFTPCTGKENRAVMRVINAISRAGYPQISRPNSSNLTRTKWKNCLFHLVMNRINSFNSVVIM